MKLRDDDEDFYVMPSTSVPASSKAKAKVKGKGVVNVVTASMTSRRLSLRAFNDLKRSLTTAAAGNDVLAKALVLGLSKEVTCFQ